MVCVSIRVLAVGRKHESWVEEGIERYERRLRKPWDVQWDLLQHSSKADDAARAEESARLLKKIGTGDYVVLLDERGNMLSSPRLAKALRGPIDQGKRVVVVLGGAFGVDESVHRRADLVWSLSDLVFPHQLVRLMLVEQVYRSQEIMAGSGYHHV